MATLWEWIKRASALLGAGTLLTIVLDAVGILPGYDISYTRKTQITPSASPFPGATIRLTAIFARRVERERIEKVTWMLADASGRKYDGVPQGDDTVDIQLLPDHSGRLNINVSAKVRGETEERTGSASIPIVQTKPRKIKLDTALQLPMAEGMIALDTVQVYEGSNQWIPVAKATVLQERGRFVIKGTTLPLWDGKAFLRYKRADNPAGFFKYEAVTAAPLEGRG